MSTSGPRRSVIDPDEEAGSVDPIEEMKYSDDPPGDRKDRARRSHEGEGNARNNGDKETWRDYNADDSGTLMGLSTTDSKAFRRLRENRRRGAASGGSGRSEARPASVRGTGGGDGDGGSSRRRRAGSDDTEVTGNNPGRNSNRGRGGRSSRVRYSGRHDEESVASSSYYSHYSSGDGLDESVDTSYVDGNGGSGHSRAGSARRKRSVREYLPWQTGALFTLGAVLMVKMGAIERKLERNQINSLRGGEEFNGMELEHGVKKRTLETDYNLALDDDKDDDDLEGANGDEEYKVDAKDELDELVKEGSSNEYPKAIQTSEGVLPPPPPGKSTSGPSTVADRVKNTIVDEDPPSEQYFRQQLALLIGEMDAAWGTAAVDDDAVERPHERSPLYREGLHEQPMHGGEVAWTYGQGTEMNLIDGVRDSKMFGQGPQQQQPPNNANDPDRASPIGGIGREKDLYPNQHMHFLRFNNHGLRQPQELTQQPHLSQMEPINQAYQQQHAIGQLDHNALIGQVPQRLSPNSLSDQLQADAERHMEQNMPPQQREGTVMEGQDMDMMGSNRGQGLGFVSGESQQQHHLKEQHPPLSQQPQQPQPDSQQIVPIAGRQPPLPAAEALAGQWPQQMSFAERSQLDTAGKNAAIDRNGIDGVEAGVGNIATGPLLPTDSSFIGTNGPILIGDPDQQGQIAGRVGQAPSGGQFHAQAQQVHHQHHGLQQRQEQLRQEVRQQQHQRQQAHLQHPMHVLTQSLGLGDVPTEPTGAEANLREQQLIPQTQHNQHNHLEQQQRQQVQQQEEPQLEAPPREQQQPSLQARAANSNLDLPQRQQENPGENKGDGDRPSDLGAPGGGDANSSGSAVAAMDGARADDPLSNESRNFRIQSPVHLFTEEEKAQLAALEGGGGSTGR